MPVVAESLHASTADADWIRQLPKAEVHLHLEGCVPLASVGLDDAARAGVAFDPDTGVPRFHDLAEFLGFLDRSCALVTDGAHVEHIAYEIARRAAANGVGHADVIFNPIHWPAWQADLDRFVERLDCGFQAGEADHGVTTALCLSLTRTQRPADSAALVDRLGELGIRVVMVTGDAAPTALAVARTVGIGDRLASAEDLRAGRGEIDFDVAAGVLPADKLALVERGQRAGRVVGMTGDGVNDAPALKRAEVGIAVSSATDVAKDAASLVLTGEGLGDVVAAVEAGRRVYQRMLTYTLNKIAKTFQVSLFLGLGLLATGSFVTTPRLVLLLLFANDFVTMSLATDRVGYSAHPDRWRVRSLSLAALAVAVPWLALSFATYLVARHALGLALAPTQTLVFVMLVATGQATVYLVRERRHLWASRPSTSMLAASTADVVIVAFLATRGILMAAVPLLDIAVVLAVVGVATIGLDFLKGPLLASVRTDTNVGHPART